MQPKIFVAMKAIVKYQGKILILREAKDWHLSTHADQYGLVGGRIEPGEYFEDGLKREVMEESGLSIKVGNPIHVDEWRPQINGETWQIVGIFFICEAENDEVVLSEEHDEFLWIDPLEYHKYNFVGPSERALKKYADLLKSK